MKKRPHLDNYYEISFLKDNGSRFRWDDNVVIIAKNDEDAIRDLKTKYKIIKIGNIKMKRWQKVLEE